MQNLEKRIAALEQANPPADELTIIRCPMSPSHFRCEITRLRDDDGKLWTRQPGESEQELIDRASLEVKRTPWGFASLTASDTEANHAKTTEQRIAALEASASDDRIKIVIVYPGETQADALTRLGLPPDVRGVVWGIPSDVDI